MVWLSAIACGVPPSTANAYPSGSWLVPDVLVVTFSVPLGVAQVTANDAVTEPPAGTVTVRDVPPVTEQVPATPDSTTVWLAAVTPVSGTVWLRPIACGVPPSTANAYPSGPWLVPDGLVVTFSVPVGVAQGAAYDAATEPPGGTVTNGDVPPG